MDEKVLEYMKKYDLGDIYRKLGEWNGYTVYEPNYIEPRFEIVGYPLYILVDKNKNILSVRGPKSLDIMDYFD